MKTSERRFSRQNHAHKQRKQGSSEFLLVNRKKEVFSFSRRLKKRAWMSIVQLPHRNKGRRHAQTQPTLVIDARTKLPLYLHRGNAAKNLEPFFTIYSKGFYKAIKAFAMDQNTGYSGVVSRYLPK